MFNIGSSELVQITALSAALMIAPFALAQVPIGQVQSDGITIKGRVADLFGDKFVLEDE